MIVVFDVGNTETTIGLFGGDEIHAHWRVMTGVTRTSDEYGLMLRAMLDSVGVHAVDGVAIGSVVPGVTGPLADACTEWLGVTPIIVDGGSKLPITLDVDEPLTVGADRIINTLAASRMYRRDTIVVDLGTATTFDCITARGVFLGGVIAPGVITAAESLTRRTSKLPATEIVAPQRTIGRRTEECIRAGVVFGAAESIDGIVRRIRAEWPGRGKGAGRAKPICVATGGLAESFKPLCTSFDFVEPHLTLVGLRMAYGILKGSDGDRPASARRRAKASRRARP